MDRLGLSGLGPQFSKFKPNVPVLRLLEPETRIASGLSSKMCALGFGESPVAKTLVIFVKLELFD
jgi:hypothetical protein